MFALYHLYQINRLGLKKILPYSKGILVKTSKTPQNDRPISSQTRAEADKQPTCLYKTQPEPNPNRSE